MRKFLSVLVVSLALFLVLSPSIFLVEADQNPLLQGQQPAPTTNPTPTPSPGTTTTTTTTGIPVNTTGLPSNLPLLNMGNVTDPVKVTEAFLLNYIIRPIFFISGGVAIIMIMYSAFQIITARGEEEGITGAKTTLLWSFVGLGLVVLAYTIVSNLASIILQLV